MLKYIEIKFDENFKRDDLLLKLKGYLLDKNLIIDYLIEGTYYYDYDPVIYEAYKANMEYDLEVPSFFNELKEVTVSGEVISMLNEAQRHFYAYLEDEYIYTTLYNTKFCLVPNDKVALEAINYEILIDAIITDKNGVLTNAIFTFEYSSFITFGIAYTEESKFEEYLNKSPGLLKQVIDRKKALELENEI